MPTAATIEEAIGSVNDQSSFIQNLLVDALNWPIEESADAISDIAYEWDEKDLRAEGLNAKIVGGKAYQIVLPGNPWGVFVLEFENPEVFTTGRGMTGVLRRVLNGLVVKKRGSRDPHLAGFNRDNLLFICNHDYERYRFAHFKPAPESGGTPPMASFGWGPDDHDAVRTICEFNLRSLEWPDSTPATEADWLNAWQPAFDIEKVTKRFYQDYADVFHRVEEIIRQTKALAGDELRMFTQSLFNRLMFLRFIERKGWLNFPGQTGTRFLASLASAGGIGKQSLYASRLRPLFFEGLAEEGRQQADAYGKVPLLNGGLFEKSDLDDKVPDIPDEAFEPIINQGELFYRYNFTVEESTPLDIEVAVDPEMLGKVFEELVTGRHESGSYYTPRPVVAFMCREALKGHLADRTKAPEPAIAKLVDDHLVEGLTEAHAKSIIDALDDLKAVDPACGSGAYLLGLLQELIAIRRALQSDKLAADPGFLYDLKLHIISHNLYGVDIDPFATEIAKLRLWLSLAVEADQPVPLPNLDFKIETGDSLLGPCDDIGDSLMANALRTRAAMLVELKDKFLKAHGTAKKKYREAIEKEEKAIAFDLRQIRGEGVIDWHIQFAEVFGKNGGFDVVLANPPYVRQELIKSIKPTIQDVYGPRIYSGIADLYTYFYARGVQLLAPGGVLSFISSNKYFRASYGSKLRKFLAQETTILSITDFGDSPVFESAVAYPMIFIAQKGHRKKQTLYTDTRVSSANLNVSDIVAERGRLLPPDALLDEDWAFTDSRIANVLSRMCAVGTPLCDYVRSRVYRGLTTGLNQAFVLNARVRDELLSRDPASADLIKPFLQGKDVGRWVPKHGNKWMIVTPIGVRIRDYPAVFAHLKEWQGALEARHDQGNHWWELRACTYYENFEHVKLLSTKVSRQPTFAIDYGGHYLGNTAYFIQVDKGDALFLLGLLNSRFSFMYAKEKFVGKQNDWYEVQPAALEQFPVPTASKAQKNEISQYVSKCVEAGGVDCEKWEAKIDLLVGRLYGVEE